MQGALSSLVRRPLGRQRGFCTHSEKIMASVLFERYPVIVPKIDPAVYAFQEFSKKFESEETLWKRFFFKSNVVGTNNEYNIRKCKDFVWATKDEILEYFPEQAEFYNKLIIS